MSPTLKAVDYARFLAAPVGSFYAGARHLLWCSDERLLGVSLWGRPDEEDIGVLLGLITVPAHPSLALGCDVVFDASRVEELDPAAIQTYLDGLTAKRAALTARVRRLALIRPVGLAGAVVAGVGFVLDGPAPWSVFTGLGPALAWLERGDEQLAAQVGLLVDEHAAGQPIVSRLGILLRASGLRLSIDEAGHQLGLGARTLQRQLRAAGTTFRAELDRVRVARAAELLASTDDKIESIAHRVGCASAAHLTTLYRRHSGTTPTEYRRSAVRK